MKGIFLLWVLILSGNFYVQAKSVSFQVLDKNITVDVYEFTPRSTDDEESSIKDAIRYGEYETERNTASSENVSNDASNEISKTGPNFHEYNIESNNLYGFNDRFNKYEADSANDILNDPNIIRVTMEIPIDDYYQPVVTSGSITKQWLRVIGIFLGIIGCIYAVYRKCLSKRQASEARSEDVSTLIVVVPKSKNAKSLGH